MATKGKAISVKIATEKVIKALEDSVAKLESDYASQKENEAKHEKAYDAYKKELINYAVANIEKAFNFRTSYRSYSNNLNIDFDVVVGESDLPVEPVRDYEVIGQYDYTSQKQEMENAIRILKMTDEETVSTSTYQAVARYL
jgi:hypothetical protein